MKTYKTAYAFFYAHAGYSYDPKKESQQQGRARCSKALAAAERDAKNAGVSFEWDRDGMTNREWTDEGEEYGTWECVARDATGEVIGSLCGVDFGPDGHPWGDSYRRVVEAEIALESL